MIMQKVRHRSVSDGGKVEREEVWLPGPAAWGFAIIVCYMKGASIVFLTM